MGDATSQRPHILFPFYVEHLVVRDLTLRRSPWWTVHILACKDVLLSNIYIDAEVAFDSTVYPTDNVDGCVAALFCAIVCCEWLTRDKASHGTERCMSRTDRRRVLGQDRHLIFTERRR